MRYWKEPAPKVGERFQINNREYEVKEFSDGDYDICRIGSDGAVWTVLEVNRDTLQIVWKRDNKKETKELLDSKCEPAQRRKQTNRKWLSRMTNEELAGFIDRNGSEFHGMTERQILDWLAKAHE